MKALASFKVELEGLLVKAKTLVKLIKIDIKKKFKDNDKGSKGYCEKIVFDYIFIEELGMSEK